MTTLPDRVNLALAVQHPDCIDSVDEFRDLLTSELREWGLTPEFW